MTLQLAPSTKVDGIEGAPCVVFDPDGGWIVDGNQAYWQICVGGKILQVPASPQDIYQAAASKGEPNVWTVIFPVIATFILALQFLKNQRYKYETARIKVEAKRDLELFSRNVSAPESEA